jgi:hypothetical protein
MLSKISAPQTTLVHISREGIQCSNKNVLWGNKDENFDVALKEFGVNINAIHNIPLKMRKQQQNIDY